MKRVEDWEMSFSIRFFAIACGQGSGKQVETGTERVKDCANPSVESERKGLFLNGHHKIVARLRIALFDDAIGMTCLPFSEAFLQKWDLGYGPIDGGLSV